MAEKLRGIRAVAELASVSPSTASKALKGTGRVSPETRARVREAAVELGYISNYLARALRNSQSETIALLGSQIATTPWVGHMVAGVLKTVEQYRSLLMIMEINPQGKDGVAVGDREALAVREHLVRGAIYASMWHRQLDVPAGLRGLPLVLLNATCTEDSVSSVVPDEEAGGRLAVQHLIDAGHRRIAFINNRDKIPAATGRLRGARAAIKSGGSDLHPLLVDRAKADPSGGYASAMSILQQADRPTALFCFSDFMAPGCYRAASDLGLRIPEDLSIVGFDGMELITESMSPSLTSVALPHFEMGVWAARQLFDELESPAHENGPRHHRLAGSLIEKSSVCPPPALASRSNRTVSPQHASNAITRVAPSR